LAPRTAQVIDLAAGERCEGPIFVTPDGQRLDRHGAARIVSRVAGRAGITKPVGPHTLRHVLSALFPCRDGRYRRRADLRSVLFDYLFLAAACRGTT
jgi:site-specific recombinase XerD